MPTKLKRLLVTIATITLAHGLAAAGPMKTPTRSTQDVSVPVSFNEQEDFFKGLYEHVAPSVVHISDDVRLGSGFFVTNDGLILTNRHVVGDSEAVTVVTFDGQSYKGKVVELGRDELDVALVKINVMGSKPMRFADPELMTIGSWTGAIGHARNLGWTFTYGILSNIHRTSNFAALQTQTPINPGNSGGPLFNKHGEVIGINTLKATDSEGLNFAIRIDSAMQALDQLLPLCACFVVETEEATPIFVDGRMAGSGKRLLIRAHPNTSYRVFTINDGVKLSKTITYPAVRRLELKP